ncbi:hypothetical protein QFZ67_007856 [Streptomyces sp. V1I1]|nr:hypothetical protein [Streptomyces sp. V1I1]
MSADSGHRARSTALLARRPRVLLIDVIVAVTR